MDLQEKNTPLVSVCLITYNHQNYIEKAVEGILIQKTNFSLEIITADDSSSDNTTIILDKYINDYPNLFVKLENVQNLGMHKNWERAIKACKGKYIALLEGDDFWTSNNKLQNQIDILELDPTIAICCTNAEVLKFNNDPHPNYVNRHEGRYSIEDLIKEAFMPTCTVVFRNYLLPAKFPKCYFSAPMADYPIHLLNAMHGDIHYIDQVTSIYRLHPSGEWGKLDHVGRLKHILGGIQCAEKILQKKEHKETLNRVKKDTLFKIASCFRNDNNVLKFLYYRIRTRLAI